MGSDLGKDELIDQLQTDPKSRLINSDLFVKIDMKTSLR